ncbi:MAG: type II secretion system protein GspE [Candidatus Omnitrophota bacterium]|nr:MAG: type II secretion system protein GspE [Candidatus Omnitrophota bacterium]
MISLKERLTEILINNKIISREQLDKALEVQKQKGGRLSDIIVELKFIEKKDLVFILSEGLGFPLIDLKRFKIDPEIVKTIPPDIARNYQIIPISKMGETITLAMADPLNIFAIDHVRSLTGYKINPIISSADEIIQAIELYYPDATRGVIDDLVKELSTSTIEVIKQDKEIGLTDQELLNISQQAPAIKITDMILDKAIKGKASDILIEPWEKTLGVRFRIDGVLKEIPSPPKSMHASIVSRIKVMSNLDIAEHRLPQDGRFKAKIANREVDFRVSILPASFGEKVAIRILDKSQATLDIDKLGFDKEAIEKIKKISKLPHGMILVCGPTGSGKTTTLYSTLKHVASPDKNLVTVEDPVEYQLEGINQVTARPEIGLSFAAALRSILRQDPDIIMIGEIRDFETVDIAIKSALTGHLILSTLHTTTASGAIVRLINMGVEPYLIDSSLVCVLSQRLLRKICTHCKTAYHIEQEVADLLKIEKTKKTEFYRGKGCPQCFNTGYAGRLGVCEVLLITPAIRELILSRSQEQVIKQQARKEGMKTLRETSLEAAIKGLTTLEEVIRVTAPDD